MSDPLLVRLLDLAVGAALVAAVVVLWRRGLRAIIGALAVQGAAVAAVALLLGLREGRLELLVVGSLIFGVKALAVPFALRRMLRDDPLARETSPLVNVPASLVIAAVLVALAFLSTSSVVALAPSPALRALPLGMGVSLVGFFVLVTRRKAVSQVVGFLLLENGIALVALLGTSGVGLTVEMGAALDVLLAVLVLQILTTRMRAKFGNLDLDQMQELHD